MDVSLPRDETEAGLADRLAASPAGARRYAVKALWRTVQGEGAQAGRPAVFVRLAGCNLWSGFEADRQRDAARSQASCPTWCFAPETPILLDDYSQRPIGEVRVGDAVLATTKPEAGRVRLVRAEVTHVQRRQAPLAALRFDTGVVAGTPDHRVLCRPSRSRERTGFVPAREAVGRRTYSLFGDAVPPLARTDEWWRGWLAGMAAGDGCFWTLRKRDRVRLVPYDRATPLVTRERGYRRFRLALADGALVDDFAYHASRLGFGDFRYGVHRGSGFSDRPLRCVHLTRPKAVEALETFLAEGDAPSDAYLRGFLGGTYDAEGSQRARGLHLCQRPSVNRDRIRRALDRLDVSYTESAGQFSIYGQAAFRFLALAMPRLARKRDRFLGRDLSQSPGSLLAVDETGEEGTVVSLTTTAGTYVLGCGQVVKNCDTDFTPPGAVKLSAADLASAVAHAGGAVRFCVLTGGEPLLQADGALIAALHAQGFVVAVETNGTQTLADAFGDGPRPDWVVCSPKLAEDRLPLEVCDELKLVVPDYRPQAFGALAARVRQQPDGRRYLWLQPEDGPRLAEATRLALNLCFEDPRWRVSVQTHKALGVD